MRVRFLVLMTLLGCTEPPGRSVHFLEDGEPASPTCDIQSNEGCEITAVIRTKLELGPDETSPGTLAYLAADRSGRIFSHTFDRGKIGVWQSDGQFEKSIGVEGEGPGELLGFPSVFIGPADTLHVMEEGGRWSVFDPEGRYVRQLSGLRLPFFRTGVFAGDGSLVQAISSPLFRILGPDGTDLRSFGGTREGDELLRRPHSVSRSERDDAFWSAPPNSLRLSEWTTSGELLRTIEPLGSRFPTEDPPISEVGAGQAANITDIMITDGIAWVIGNLPDPSGRVPGEEEDLRDYFDPDVSRLYKDFVIEAVDLMSGRVVASVQSDRQGQTVSGFLGGGLGYRWGDGPGPYYPHSIVDIRLTRR